MENSIISQPVFLFGYVWVFALGILGACNSPTRRGCPPPFAAGEGPSTRTQWASSGWRSRRRRASSTLPAWPRANNSKLGPTSTPNGGGRPRRRIGNQKDGNQRRRAGITASSAATSRGASTAPSPSGRGGPAPAAAAAAAAAAASRLGRSANQACDDVQTDICHYGSYSSMGPSFSIVESNKSRRACARVERLGAHRLTPQSNQTLSLRRRTLLQRPSILWLMNDSFQVIVCTTTVAGAGGRARSQLRVDITTSSRLRCTQSKWTPESASTTGSTALVSQPSCGKQENRWVSYMLCDACAAWLCDCEAVRAI